MSSVVTVGILKLGCIGTSSLLEFLLDERADRGDISTIILGSGSKMTEKESELLASKLVEFKPDLVIAISPNASLPGPKKAREILAESGLPTVIISDSPAKKVRGEIDKQGMGYIIIEADPMIGARREFLDPIEMALFNSDIIRVLAVTGVFAIVYSEIDKLIDSLKKGEPLTLPKIVINYRTAVEAMQFTNPYAKAKAIAAFEIARNVANLTKEGCFVEKEMKNYILIVAAAHEMLRYAAKLADEAREIEKYGDALLRRPHNKEGNILLKRKLLEKPISS